MTKPHKPPAQNRKHVHELRERLGDSVLTLLTIMLLILLFVVGPLQAAGFTAVHYFGLLFAVVLLGAVFILSGSKIAVAAIVVSLALALTATIFRLSQPSTLDVYLDATAWLLAGVALAVVTARAVFAEGEVNFHRVIGAVLLYLTIGLIFVSLYGFVEVSIPNSFNGLPPLRDDLSVSGNLIYFSFTTLTSVGYGDIVPVHPIARSLANIESIIGQLYPATLLARLVTLELESRGRR
jgi:hypothetical protein